MVGKEPVKEPESGEGATGDGGERDEPVLFAVPVELVDGLSAPPRAMSTRDCKKAL